MEKNNSPEEILLRIERLKILNTDPEQQAKRLEKLRIYTSSPEHQEHLKKLVERRSFKVEILDTENNETAVYSSVRAAARVIGCGPQTILNAMKTQEEKGVPSLIKKRYTAKRLAKD